MAVINKHVGEFNADAYNADGEFLGNVETICELLDFRVQIKTEHKWGYYLIVHKKDGTDTKVTIDGYGNLSDYPDEFEFSTKCLLELI